MKIILADEAATAQWAQQFSKVLISPCVVYLCGELGAGKTTLVRHLLRSMGYEGAVKSPTYTLVESYELSKITFHHFDLYRMSHPEELLQIGIDDFCQQGAVLLIEWPDKGDYLLPEADVICTMTPLQKEARKLTVIAISAKGNDLLNRMEKCDD